MVCAGFPCQPFSVAGKQRAGFDPKNQWPATIDIIRVVRPRYVFLENVTGLLAGSHGYFGHILGELAASGYDAQWEVLSAADCGAPHRRDRLWIVATNADRQGEFTLSGFPEVAGKPSSYGAGQESEPSDTYGDTLRKQQESERRCGNKAESEFNGASQPVADAQRQRFAQQGQSRGSVHPTSQVDGQAGWVNHVSQWLVEPDVGRVADGVAHRMDRLRALGNGWVPVVGACAWNRGTS